MFRYGRKTILLVSYTSATIFSIASAVSNSFIMFAAFRFLTGFSLSGISIVAIVLCESTSVWVLTLIVLHEDWTRTTYINMMLYKFY